MENSVIEINQRLRKINEGTNLVIQLQETYTKLNKGIDNTAELITLRDGIVKVIQQEKLHRSEIDLAFKIYYKTLQKLNVTVDNEFFENFDEYFDNQPFILNAILFTNFQLHLEEVYLKDLSYKVFLRCIAENSKHLITILKALNLFTKRFPQSVIEVTLDDVYFCLQNNNGIRVRDEILQLFEHIQKSLIESGEVTYIVLNNIPWINKTKFYLLSVIFKVHSFEFVKNLVDFENEHFFEGVRLSLSSKYLFSASQYLIKSLNNSESDAFTGFILKIFDDGTEKEMINLNSQWWRYIGNREKIYLKLNIEIIFENILRSPQGAFRYLVICYLFRNNILKSHESMFCKIFIYFINNFKAFCTNGQLFIYKFIIETLSNLNLLEKNNMYENILNFFIEFFKDNISNSVPEFRQIILEKIPEIFNFISKLLCNPSKIASTRSVELINDIEIFFCGIRDIYEYGISSMEYQPIIFSLKLISQTLNIIYLNSGKKNLKDHNTLQNRKLAEFSNNKEIFDFKIIRNQLVELLNNELIEYDDVQIIAVNTINSIKSESVDYNHILEQCKQKCKNSNYDKCRTSSLFASLIIDKNSYIRNNLHEFCLQNLNYCFQKFEEDPFLMCKSGYHLFGYINCLNQCYLNRKIEYDKEIYEKVVEICLHINRMILKLLKIASKNIDENTSASFEIMDESLEILLKTSKIKSDDNVRNRKFLLLSFWTTLKATCDIATTIGVNLINTNEGEENDKIKIFEKCLDINTNVLYKCRHKGAIEAAGVSLGILVRHTTSTINHFKFYKTLFKCFDVLFSSVSHNSLTRRGAGLSIMFHHLLKNDMHKSKLLFYQAMKTLMLYVQKSETPIEKVLLKTPDNGENFDALMLHYLCVLVKDTELKECVVEYYDDIMMAAIRRIEHREWCVRNAALQLFGGLTPKIVGQKQASGLNNSGNLGSIDVTLREISIKLPKTLFYIFEYCNDNNTESKTQKSNSTIILFLEFLSNIEYLKLNLNDSSNHIKTILMQYRELFWKFLSHKCEKIRKLSATCLVCFHNFSDEVTSLILHLMRVFYLTSEPNFEQGLIFSLIDGVNKVKNEKFLNKNYEDYFALLRTYFVDNYKDKELPYSIRIKLLDLLILLEFDLKCNFVSDFIMDKENDIGNEFNFTKHYDFGYFLWREKVKMLSSQN